MIVMAVPPVTPLAVADKTGAEVRVEDAGKAMAWGVDMVRVVRAAPPVTPLTVADKDGAEARVKDADKVMA